MTPLALFDVDRPAVEERAVTPEMTSVQQAAPTVPFAFERSAAVSLGFSMPMVPPGQANYPVVSTGAPAGSVDKGSAASATAAASGWTPGPRSGSPVSSRSGKRTWRCSRTWSGRAASR